MMKTLGHIKHIHLIGIGGIGMSGIAELLIKMNYKVSGSDIGISTATKRIAEIGGRIFIGHKADNIIDSDAVVYSSAIPADNPEIIKAEELNIPVIPRAEMLAALMRPKQGIAIAGSHGKTTTTAIAASILLAGGIDPTVLLGGRLETWDGSNARLGKGDIFVAEADESDGSLMALSPVIAVVTNMDLEHVDHYGNMDGIRSIFLKFISKIPFYGLAILCVEDEEVQNIVPAVNTNYITYGMTSQAEIYAANIKQGPFNNEFDVIRKDISLGRVNLKLPGRHNILNALAAITVALECGVTMDKIRKGLVEVCGPDRRFQIKGENADITVVDDYGHHPTEIEATLETARNTWPDRRLVVLFQPHRYSRTRDLYDRFIKCFDKADLIIIAPVYSAGESPINGIDSEWLYQGVLNHGHKGVMLSEDLGNIQDLFYEIIRPCDVIITLGAGDIHKVGDDLLKRMNSNTLSQCDGGLK